MSAGARPGRFHRPELDGLRFLAFLAVFVHHGPWASLRGSGLPASLESALRGVCAAGAFGVDLFFVLSSYLITELLLRELETRGALDVPGFYARRALRIWPLYFVFLSFAVLVLPRLWPAEEFRAGAAVAYFAFLGNWACALGSAPRSVAALLWSVSVEEQFYLAWPLLVRAAGASRLKAAVASLFAVSLAVRVLLVLTSAQHPATWCNTLARLDPIACGALVALFLRARPGLSLGAGPRAALAAMGVALWLVVARVAPVSGPATLQSALFGYPAIALGATALLVAALAGKSFLSAKGLAWLGRISYGLYVFHELAYAIAAGWTSSLLLEGLIAFALTVTLSTASYFLLEQPFLRLKARFAHVPSGAASA